MGNSFRGSRGLLWVAVVHIGGQHGANIGPSEELNRPMGNGPGMGWGNGDKMAGEERDESEWEGVGERRTDSTRQG